VSTRIAQVARHAGLGQHLGSEAEPQTRRSIGGLLAVAACLVGLSGCLVAFAAEAAVPLSAGGLLSLTILIAAGLGVTAGWVSRPGAVVHCYEHGAVVEPRLGRGQPQALHRTQLIPYEWIPPDGPVPAGDHVSTLQLRTAGSDGREIARYSGVPAARLAELMVVWDLPYALDRLADGGRLRYGELLIDLHALQVHDRVLPWARIRGIQPSHDELVVYVRDEELPVARVDARSTPHRRALQAIAMHLATAPGLSRQASHQPDDLR
jgi:hypothetical protein